MISHTQAQELISARLDAPLDPVSQRELLAHLAGCASCRTFADQTELMARDLRGMPLLPASPTVSRVVLERINAGRSPWARFGDLFGRSANPMPAAALALLALLLVGGLAVARFTADDEPDEPTRLLMAPTEQAEQVEATRAASELIVASPTELPELPNITVTLTPTPLPTATSTPAPTATATSSPEPTATATSTPAPTATATATPEPTATATSTPAPTETPLPTATATPQPTATATSTPVPTATPTPTETPLPTATATATSTSLPTATATSEPTATPQSAALAINTPTTAPTDTPVPTATETPLPTETNTPIPTPTETPMPTATATVQASPTPVPVETSPAIVPAEGSTVESVDVTPTASIELTGDGPSTPAAVAAEDDADDEAATVDGEPIEPIDDDDNSGPGGGDDDDDTSGPGSDDGEGGDDDDSGPRSSDDEDDESGDDDGPLIVDGQPVEPIDPTATVETNGEDETPAIVPADGTGGSTATLPAVEETPETTETPAVTEPTGDEPGGLGDAPVYDDDPNGDPNGRLTLRDGDPVLVTELGQAGLTAYDGELRAVPADGGQSVAFCLPGGECRDLSSESAAGIGQHTDTPVGWIGTSAIYERRAGERVEYHAVDLESGEDVQLIEGGSEIGLNGTVIDLGDTLLVPGAGSWVRLTASDGANLGPNTYGQVSLVRTDLPGDRIGFVAGGQLIIAPVDAPASPVAQLPFTGVGYDLAPDGERIVVSDGQTLSIIDLSGNLLGTFPNPDGIDVGSVLWLDNGTILFVDLSNNVVRSIDPAEAG